MTPFSLSTGLIFLWAPIMGLMVIAPQALAPIPPEQMSPAERLQGPSLTHPLGTDEFGRSILSRVVYGGQTSLLIALSSVGLAMLFGVPLGTIAGYCGGWIDSLIMRLQDVLLAFPAILFAILLIATFGPSPLNLVLTIAVVHIPRFARLQRGSVLMVKSRPYVEAARACGIPPLGILMRTILPNTTSPLIIQSTLSLAIAVLIESGLSYMGLGIQPPDPTWGVMLKTSQTYIRLAPHYVLAPGVFLFLTVLSLNLLGDWLRDRLDPRSR
ncbi:MAG: ABC transporter permease [Roseiflexaceae bacterium]|nr:ABC transporter permease [Roseiflexaceae bacterium]